MGALTSTRSNRHKREIPKKPFAISNSTLAPHNFQISKKRHKFSPPSSLLLHHIPPQPPSCVSSSCVDRISRRPESRTRSRRKQLYVRSPCRLLKLWLFKPRTRRRTSGDVMGNLISKKFHAWCASIGALMKFVKGEEVIDLESDSASGERRGKKVVVYDDSSVEEVVGVSDDENDEVRVLVKRSSDVMEVENLGKMVDSLGVKMSDVKPLKKLWEAVKWNFDRLRQLVFQTELNEKRRNAQRLPRPVRKPVETPVAVIPPETFMPLTNDEVAEVKLMFSPNYRRKVLVSHRDSSIDISGEILQCLRPGAWLNDEVINLYLALLKEREIREPHKFVKCHFFNSFFFKKLASGENGAYDYKAVRRWTTERKLGYFLIDCDKIFIPVHQQTHWCLAIINRKDQKFQYLDSLKGRDFRVLKYLAKYYVDEVKDKSGKDIDVSNWEFEFVEDLPLQRNGYDCGVFMIKYADFHSRCLPLCFSQEHMPYFRVRTAKEILKLRAN